MAPLPDLSRFELQCLRILWRIGDGTIREIRGGLDDRPTYSTVKKIVERLEEKGAVERIRKREKAWVYRSTVPAPAMIRKEIRRFLDLVFDGDGAPLAAHLADMNELSVDDLREIESIIEARSPRGKDGTEKGTRKKGGAK